MVTPTIRLRIDFNPRCALGPGKIQVLETIELTGSLSAAARDMGMSYRRAWLLVESLNTGFDQPVVTAQAGGPRGGGMALTPFGRQLIQIYRQLHGQVGALAQQSLRSLARHVAAEPVGKPDLKPPLRPQRLSRHRR